MSSGWIDELRALKGEIAAARMTLVNMILYSDRHGPEQQRLAQDTADAVNSHLSKLQAPDGKAAEFMDLKETWDSFQETREKELLPAILGEEKAIYEKIGAGIQKERLDHMYALLALLEK